MGQELRISCALEILNWVVPKNLAFLKTGEIPVSPLSGLGSMTISS
jgi:hypothetical protein